MPEPLSGNCEGVMCDGMLNLVVVILNLKPGGIDCRDNSRSFVDSFEEVDFTLVLAE